MTNRIFNADNMGYVTLSDLIDSQTFRVIKNGVFKEEAAHIAEMVKLENLTTVVDIGCWTGALAYEVLKKIPDIENYILIDAVPIYMQKALSLNKNRNFKSIEVTLLPDNFEGTPPKSMLISSSDTLNSSSIYSNKFLSDRVKSANKTVELAAAKNVNEFVKDNLELFNSKNYVKIDLDGVDLNLIKAIYQNQCRPGALQFEVWNTFRKSYDEFKSQLSQMNYKVPDINLDIHQHFSVGISEHNWWAVGYDNVSTNPKSTYYRSY